MEKEKFGNIESRAENLGTYIEMYKNQIILPNEEISDPETKEELLKMKNHFLKEIGGWREGEKQKLNHRLEYIDGKGNLIGINLVIDDIADLKEKIIDKEIWYLPSQEKIVREELHKLGFNNWWEKDSEEELRKADEILQDEIKRGWWEQYKNDEKEYKTKIEKRKQEILSVNKQLKFQKIGAAVNDYKKRSEGKNSDI
jgi:hypothetical protein